MLRGKRTIFILTLIVVVTMTLSMVGCKNIARDIPKGETFDAGGYETTFFDDFDGDSLDGRYWRIMTGDRPTDKVRDHIYRGGYYSDDADIISVKDGNLTISTRYKEGEYGNGWYSAWIDTTTNNRFRAYEDTSEDFVGFSQQYGYFEVRCIAPPAEGMWSAFWLMPNEGKAFTKEDVAWSGRDGIEIDVMESQNYFRKKPYVQHVLHADYGGSSLKSEKSPIYKVPDMYAQFHTYGVEWTEDKIAFYIDGYKTYETAFVVDGKTMGVPEVKESMILSCEIAGHSDKDGNVYPGIDKATGKESWLGSIEKMDKTKSYDFVIDYVKVMQKKASK